MNIVISGKLDINGKGVNTKIIPIREMITMEKIKLNAIRSIMFMLFFFEWTGNNIWRNKYPGITSINKIPMILFKKILTFNKDRGNKIVLNNKQIITSNGYSSNKFFPFNMLFSF
jgi:hypothetical protein